MSKGQQFDMSYFIKNSDGTFSKRKTVEQPREVKLGRKPHKEVQEDIYKDSLEVSQKINIKPLSVNEAWQGKRFKTPAYTKYEKKVLSMLNDIKLPATSLKLTIEYGFSNKASDIDNPTKLVLDILQKKYFFDDKEIYELNLIKKIVDKGNEYFSFKITPYTK